MGQKSVFICTFNDLCDKSHGLYEVNSFCNHRDTFLPAKAAGYCGLIQINYQAENRFLLES